MVYSSICLQFFKSVIVKEEVSPTVTQYKNKIFINSHIEDYTKMFKNCIFYKCSFTYLNIEEGSNNCIFIKSHIKNLKLHNNSIYYFLKSAYFDLNIEINFKLYFYKSLLKTIKIKEKVKNLSLNKCIVYKNINTEDKNNLITIDTHKSLYLYGELFNLNIINMSYYLKCIIRNSKIENTSPVFIMCNFNKITLPTQIKDLKLYNCYIDISLKENLNTYSNLKINNFTPSIAIYLDTINHYAHLIEKNIKNLIEEKELSNVSITVVSNKNRFYVIFFLEIKIPKSLENQCEYKLINSNTYNEKAFLQGQKRSIPYGKLSKQVKDKIITYFKDLFLNVNLEDTIIYKDTTNKKAFLWEKYFYNLKHCSYNLINIEIIEYNTKSYKKNSMWKNYVNVSNFSRDTLQNTKNEHIFNSHKLYITETRDYYLIKPYFGLLLSFPAGFKFFEFQFSQNENYTYYMNHNLVNLENILKQQVLNLIPDTQNTN